MVLVEISYVHVPIAWFKCFAGMVCGQEVRRVPFGTSKADAEPTGLPSARLQPSASACRPRGGARGGAGDFSSLGVQKSRGHAIFPGLGLVFLTLPCFSWRTPSALQ